MLLAFVFSEVEAVAEVVTKVVSERVEGVFLLFWGLFIADIELVKVSEVVELVFRGLCGFRCVFVVRIVCGLFWLLLSPRWRVRVQVFEVVFEVDLVGLVVGVVEFVQILQIFQVVEV